MLLVFGIAGGLFFAYERLTSATHLSPTPSYSVDIGSTLAPTSTGNTYNEDQDSDGMGEDQLMSVVTPLTPCLSRTVGSTNFFDGGTPNPVQFRIVTDIVIENADEAVAGDVHINRACTTAPADDDPEGTRHNNIRTRDLPIVRIVQ